MTCDGADEPRVADAVGRWLAVVFLPDDVALAGGGASERRRYLDRMLSLADRTYLRALDRLEQHGYRFPSRKVRLLSSEQREPLARRNPVAASGATCVRNCTLPPRASLPY